MVRNQKDVKIMQELLGVSVDGIWGPETDAAYQRRRAEEAARDNAGFTAPPAGVSRKAEVAERLGRTAATPVTSFAFRPSVDNDPSLPYTGSVNTPAAYLYQQIILNALTKPAPSATAGTTNAGNPPGTINKQVKGKVPKSSDPPELIPNTYADGNPPGTVNKPVKGKVPKSSELIPNTYADEGLPKPEVVTKIDDYRPFRLFDGKDYAVLNASNMLNLMTAQENKETCCNLYSAVINGRRVYFTGEVFVGNQFNVVVPYLADALWEKQEVLAGKVYDLEGIRFEGFMHAHPYNKYSNTFSGGIGDAAVALLSGEIYLTTPDGNIYDLTRPEDILDAIYIGFAEYMNSIMAQTPMKSADAMDYLNAWEDFLKWYNNPPEMPYNGLRSIDTTKISIKDDAIYHDLLEIIQQIIERYAERRYERYKDVWENFQWAPLT